MFKWDWCHDSYRVPKYRNRLKHSWRGCIDAGYLSFGLVRHHFVYTGTRRKDYLQARETKGSAVRNESDTSLPASSVSFFLRSLFIPGGPIGPIGELCPRADPYVGYVCMRNEKIASGERGDQCVMEDPLSFPLRRAFRGSHGRVTMNGRYYFIGDQAKSKIEKRTARDERK